jgi:hypothetical protein
VTPTGAPSLEEITFACEMLSIPVPKAGERIDMNKLKHEYWKLSSRVSTDRPSNNMDGDDMSKRVHLAWGILRKYDEVFQFERTTNGC